MNKIGRGTPNSHNTAHPAFASSNLVCSLILTNQSYCDGDRSATGRFTYFVKYRTPCTYLMRIGRDVDDWQG